MKRFLVLTASFLIILFKFPIITTPDSDLPNRFFNNRQDGIIQENYQMTMPKILVPATAPTYKETNTLFQTDYFAPYYFSNLRENFGNNIKGSCSYVAVDMLLSFYDSYWNDNFIPEKYDGTNELIGSNSVLDTFNSPGTKTEQDYSSIQNSYSNVDYLTVVNEYKDQILHLDLLSRGINDYGIYNIDASLPCGTFLSTMEKITYDYLDESTSLNRSDVNIVYSSGNSDAMRNTIVKKVKQGIPVVVDAIISGGAHSFVAYDYDEINDELYGNAGWYAANPKTSSYVHKSFTSFGCSSIQEILYFEPTVSHSHSNNYVYIDEKNALSSLCPCTSVIPTNVTINDNYLDLPPTFNWNTLIKDRWFENIGLYHELSILDSNRQVVYTKSKIFDNQYTLSTSEFTNVLNLPLNSYYIYIGLASDVDPYWDEYYCCAAFNKPNIYLNKSSFLPSNWGFIGRYYFSNELTAERLATEPERKNTTVTSNGFTVTTDRLRCGYIENSYVVLSPRRENAGRAYFEMNFDKAVYSFMYRACLWSSSENIDGYAFICVKDINGNWTTLKNIPLCSLKTKANGLTQFVEQTPFGIYGLRFEITSSAVGTKNKGRFCIDDIVFSTKSGSANNTYVNCNYSTKA